MEESAKGIRILSKRCAKRGSEGENEADDEEVQEIDKEKGWS